MQLVEWIDKGEMDEEQVKKSIHVFNIAGEVLAKMMQFRSESRIRA